MDVQHAETLGCISIEMDSVFFSSSSSSDVGSVNTGHAVWNFAQSSLCFLKTIIALRFVFFFLRERQCTPISAAHKAIEWWIFTVGTVAVLCVVVTGVAFSVSFCVWDCGCGCCCWFCGCCIDLVFHFVFVVFCLVYFFFFFGERPQVGTQIVID